MEEKSCQNSKKNHLPNLFLSVGEVAGKKDCDTNFYDLRWP